MSRLITGEDPLKHLQDEIAATRADAEKNANNSREYWLARLSGLEHAHELWVAMLTARPTP